MKTRKGLSLKYKILFVLTLLPLVMLGIYLIVALRTFKSDKIAYVYESSASVARTLSAQASTELGSLLTSTKPIMQEFLSKGNFAEVSEGIFGVDSPLRWVAVYAPNPDTPTKLDQLGVIEKDEISSETEIQQMDAKNSSFQATLLEALRNGRVIQVPFRDDRVLLIERVGGEKIYDSKIFVIMAQLTELANAFRMPGSSENFLITEQGDILFGPAGLESTMISAQTGIEFLRKIIENKFSSGAQAIRTVAGEDMLASFSKSSFAGTTVVSLTPQSEALKAIKLLVIRSLLFVFMLISATVIISLFASGNLTSALSDLFLATRRVAEGHFDIRVKSKSNDEVGSLADSFNTMAEEVQRLMVETAEKARMESELKTAQTVQETLFPEAESDFGYAKISGYYVPASECGGDWWHYCEIEEKLFLWIGDATGHGAPAALITSAAKSAASIIERLSVDPAHALNLLNRSIQDVSKGRIMMTFFLACIDKETGTMTYSNASHEAPFLIKHGEKSPIKKDLIPLNDVNNPRLGESRETRYEQTEIQLDPGDRILFYTDGVLDVQSPKLEIWGEREFIKAILSSVENYPSANIMVNKLSAAIAEYRQGAPLKDDVTFFVCEYVGKTS